MKMKQILLLTDFSDNSWNALFTALKLYEDVEAKFYLMHSFEPITEAHALSK